MHLIYDDIKKYLEESYYINWKDPDILQLAEQLSGSSDEIENIKRIYYYVRDEIKHSWDAADDRITIRASEVLQEKVGICYAKANLLSALLRAIHIPSGICYQRLTLGDTPAEGYCLHALNAFYLSSIDKWIRIDARGNKPGVNADIHIHKEQLAFQVRTELGEIDYKDIYSEPFPATMNVLETSTDASYMYLHSLPDKI